MPFPLNDRLGRTHRSLRISIIDKCDLRCTYCMPEDQRFLQREQLITREEIATITRLFVQRYGITKVRLTGGEPLVRPDAVGIVRDLSGLGVSLGLTTNALSLHKHLDALIEAGLRHQHQPSPSIPSASSRSRDATDSGPCGRTSVPQCRAAFA